MEHQPNRELVNACVSILCTAVALILFAKGVNLGGLTNASILSTLEPMVGAFLRRRRFLILNEPISWSIIIGSILIILSVPNHYPNANSKT